jgi:hypothetical protein
MMVQPAGYEVVVVAMTVTVLDVLDAVVVGPGVTASSAGASGRDAPARRLGAV